MGQAKSGFQNANVLLMMSLGLPFVGLAAIAQVPDQIKEAESGYKLGCTVGWAMGLNGVCSELPFNPNNLEQNRPNSNAPKQEVNPVLEPTLKPIYGEPAGNTQTPPLR
jgi:hypothetical protein